MVTHRPPLILLAVMVLLAGCTASLEAPTARSDGALDSTDVGPVAGGAGDSRDRIGWEGGYWHNDSINLNRSDGVSEAELEAYLARAMARVELLRGHEFTRPIRIEVETRESLRAKIERTGSFASNEPLSPETARIMNVYWEAMFFVGEDEDVRAVRATEGASFLGAYYRFGSDRIRIVAPANETPIVDESLLVHELVHALQDEYAGTPLETTTDDDNYATAALIEGDAVFVTRQFRKRCGDTWECVEVPSRGGGGGGDIHAGFRTLRGFAYSDGPAFVHRLYEGEGPAPDGGWTAVDGAFETRPRTTEEIIHPARYPLETPPQPGPTVNPRDDWRHLGGPFTVGELGIFGLYWYQAETEDVPVLDPASIRHPDGGVHDRLNFSASPSTGWDGDSLTVVVNGDEDGYVWITRWDTERDAREFVTAYRQVLRSKQAQQMSDGTWVIHDGPFADAYAVERIGRTVRVVNGPTPADLAAIFPSTSEDR
ncbi:MAG: Hvo_1808 family surface protein [Halobacteriales archaeon]|nr:Hvo_1808 family surface protein [Halobacteriales archaeon]